VVLLRYRGSPKHRPLYRLNFLQTLLAILLLAWFCTVLCLWIQPNSLRQVLGSNLRQPLLILLNGLPIGLLLLSLTFLFQNVFAAACLTGGAWAALSIANTVKQAVRYEPVMPRDFALLKEALTAAADYSIRWPAAAIAVTVLSAVGLGVLAWLADCDPLPGGQFQSWGPRLLCAIAPLALLAVLLPTLYASDAVYQSFTCSSPYNIPVVFNELGFPYNFCHHLFTYPVDKPEGYSRAEAEEWEIGDLPGQGVPVNMVIVMDEAFSDLTDAPAFTWPEEEDPLQNLHALRRDGHALSGHLVIPSFAGGTASTEFDVLTGIRGQELSPVTTSPFRAVNRNLDSLFRVFNGDGYATSFLHPGYDWFYNRENVYRWLGAQETVFEDEMADKQYKGSGTWVSDDYLAGLIEGRFEAAMDSGELFFNYTTTIQNHMSYTADKYGPDYDFPPLQTTASLDDEMRTMIEVYVEGARDADAMLGRLAEYFRGREEPVVLVFFGDHLPYLGDGGAGYAALGIDLAPDSGEPSEEYLRSYEVPYVVWANDAAAEALDWAEAVEALELPSDDTISACFLGSVLLELTGRGDESPWFAFSGQLRREVPVLHSGVCVTADGGLTVAEDLTEDQRELLEKAGRWTYYKMKTKEVT